MRKNYHRREKICNAPQNWTNKEKVKDINGITLYSNQGQHCKGHKYQEALKSIGIIQGMSRKGDCPDNAVIEHFFSI